MSEAGHNTDNYENQGGNTWTIGSGGIQDVLIGGMIRERPALLSGSTDAIPPHLGQTYMVTATGVDAMTLATPTAGGDGTGDDGIVITVISAGAHAHTITSTGNLNTGSTSVNVATFAAHAGASVELMAYNGAWYVLSEIGITFS